MILKKTYLRAKRCKTRRLCPFTPRRPFHCPVFVLAGRFRRDFVVRSCNVKILEVSKKKHKEIKKKNIPVNQTTRDASFVPVCTS